MSDETWNFERVRRMIDDGIEESLHLDYKAAGSLSKIDRKKEEIVKDVTAFANSDGGLIIYGVREHTDHARKHLPSEVDPINRADLSKEWLEHVISNAAPRINGIRIHPIPIPDDETKCLYVVEIPKGETAHQSSDCKYYRRYNFESVAMRDHEVRDVMNRIKVPRLEVRALLSIRGPREENSLVFEMKNVSNRIARQYLIVGKIPVEMDGIHLIPNGDQMVLDKDESGHFFGFSLGMGLANSPLFPKATIRLKIDLKIPSNILMMMQSGQPLVIRPFIDLKVYADEMIPLQLQFAPKLILDVWAPPTSSIPLDS
jgi:hypothetical protein